MHRCTRTVTTAPLKGKFGGTFTGLQDPNFTNTSTGEFIASVCRYWSTSSESGVDAGRNAGWDRPCSGGAPGVGGGPDHLGADDETEDFQCNGGAGVTESWRPALLLGQLAADRPVRKLGGVHVDVVVAGLLPDPFDHFVRHRDALPSASRSRLCEEGDDASAHTGRRCVHVGRSDSTGARDLEREAELIPARVGFENRRPLPVGVTRALVTRRPPQTGGQGLPLGNA